MRDPLARWLSAGLILALPILIHIVSATSAASTNLSSLSSPRAIDPIGALVLVLVEALMATGIWMAARQRQQLQVRP
jgi:hypothetical protein